MYRLKMVAYGTWPLLFRPGLWEVLLLIMALFPVGLGYSLRALPNRMLQRAAMSQVGSVCHLKPVCHCV